MSINMSWVLIMFTCNMGYILRAVGLRCPDLGPNFDDHQHVGSQKNVASVVFAALRGIRGRSEMTAQLRGNKNFEHLSRLH